MYFSSSEPLRISPIASRSHHGQVWKEARQGREGQDAPQDVAEGRQEAKEEEGRNQVRVVQDQIILDHRRLTM